MDDSPATRPSLLVRLRDRQDRRSWEEFYAIYRPLIFRTARRQGFQEVDAAELTQEVFISVAAAVERWDPNPQRGSFRGWLFRTTKNLAINLLAAQRRRPTGSGDSGVQRMLAEQPAPNAEDSALIEKEYQRQALAWAAEQIRPEFRDASWQAFWLSGVENLSPTATAERLGMSVGAVYVARSRVMARLREKIDELKEE